MKIKDLGDLVAPVVVFGGPYSNLQALQVMHARCEDIGISPQNIICTGDAAAYCAHPEECIQFLRDWGIHVLAGNCEKNLSAGIDDCGCGFDADTTCSLLSRSWYAHAQSQVSKQSMTWMASLPDRIVFRLDQKRFAVIHGGVSDISAFIWPNSTDKLLAAEMVLLETQVGAVDAVIAGHSGMTMQRTIDGKDWINAGVIGMPSNNGETETDYVVLNAQKARFEKLRYDWTAAQQAMIDVGLVQGYHNCLETGFWPSEDILPSELRRQSAKG